MTTTILLATSNPHKLDEIRAVWSALADEHRPDPAHPIPAIELVGLGDLNLTIPEPIEDGDTFEANAILKARYYAAATGRLCLADDSGLEVDALAGQPGVRSARFAGLTGPRPEVDAANNALLLKKLADTPPDKRTARFVCAMALCAPTRPDTPDPTHSIAPNAEPNSPPDVLICVRGTIEGRIIGPGEPPRGRNGFGYDPLFFVPHLGQTTAGLTPEEKNAISHRGQAARKIWQALTNSNLLAQTPDA